MTGAERIAEERTRQITQEGFTPEHDQEHHDGALLKAAACYIAEARLRDAGLRGSATPLAPGHGWPWDSSWWKPSDDPIRNLEKAGALIAAEIDRLLQKGQPDA